MSNFYSKITQMKRNSEPANMSYSQTHWISGNDSIIKKQFSERIFSSFIYGGNLELI